MSGSESSEVGIPISWFERELGVEPCNGYFKDINDAKAARLAAAKSQGYNQ